MQAGSVRPALSILRNPVEGVATPFRMETKAAEPL